MSTAFQPLSSAALFADLPRKKKRLDLLDRAPVPQVTAEDVQGKVGEALPYLSAEALQSATRPRSVIEPVRVGREALGTEAGQAASPMLDLTAETRPRIAGLPQAANAMQPLSADELYGGGANLPTLQAENAPLASQVTRGGPYVELVNEAQRSDNPQVRHAARRDALGSYADYVEPELPPEPTVTDHSGEKRSFLQNVGHHVKHGLRGALIGLAEGGLGGAAVGLVGGSASPKFTDTLQHNLIDEPRWKADVARIEGQAGKRLDRARDVAGITGRGLDGQLTEGAQNAATATRNSDRQAKEFTFSQERFNAQQKQHDEDRQRQASGQSLTRLGQFTRTAPHGTPIPKDIAEAAGLPSLAGQPIREDRQTGEKTITDKATGKVYTLKGGKIAPVVDPAGKPFSITPAPTKAPQVPWATHRARGFQSALKQRGFRSADQMVGNPEHEDYFQTLKAENEQSVAQYGAEARLSDEALHARAAKKYPRNVKAGSLISNEEADSYAAQEFQSGGRARPVTTPTKKADGARKVGDSVMMKGKQYRIAVIHPNGDYELEPMQ